MTRVSMFRSGKNSIKINLYCSPRALTLFYGYSERTSIYNLLLPILLRKLSR
jgi:hypothetical protein